MIDEQFNKLNSYMNQPKPWYEVMRTWLPTILLIVGAIYSIVGPWNKVTSKLDKIESDIMVIQWVIREVHGDEEPDVKEWIPNPFGNRRPTYGSIKDIPKPYEQFNCIVVHGTLKFD